MGRMSPRKSGGVLACDKYQERAMRALWEMEKRLMTVMRTIIKMERVVH